jgi:hypothetical protein
VARRIDFPQTAFLHLVQLESVVRIANARVERDVKLDSDRFGNSHKIDSLGIISDIALNLLGFVDYYRLLVKFEKILVSDANWRTEIAGRRIGSRRKFLKYQDIFQLQSLRK